MKEQLKASLTEFVQFVITMLLLAGVMYVEVIVYGIITLKEYVMKCVC